MHFIHSEVFLPRPQETAIERGNSTNVIKIYLQETAWMNLNLLTKASTQGKVLGNVLMKVRFP
jgi:hypothetical protein